MPFVETGNARPGQRLGAVVALTLLPLVFCAAAPAAETQADEPNAAASAHSRALRIGYVGEPFRFDPFEAESSLERDVLSLLYRRLLDPTPDGRRFLKGTLLEWYRPVPGFRDGPNGRPTLEYEFQLRPNARFTDGTPVTSNDVAETVERLRQSGRHEIGRYVVGVDVLATRRFRIEIREHPFPERLFAFFVASARRPASNESAVSKPLSGAPGTGPYALVGRFGDGSVELAPANLPHEKQPRSDAVPRIVLDRFAASETQNAVRQLDRGELDMLLGLRTRDDELSQVDLDRFQVCELSRNSVWVVAFNHQSDVFRNRAARRAAHLAIDAAALNRGPAGSAPSAGEAEKDLTGPFPPDAEVSDHSVRPRGQNLLVARSIVDSLPGVADRPLVLLVSGRDPSVEQAAARVARDLSAAGFRVGVDVAGRPLAHGEPDAARRFDLLLYRVEHDPGVTQLYRLFDPTGPILHGAETNFLGYAPQSLLQQFVSLRNTSSHGEFVGIAHRIHRYFYDDVTFVPLWCERTYAAWSNRLSGPACDPETFDTRTLTRRLFVNVADWQIAPVVPEGATQ